MRTTDFSRAPRLGRAGAMVVVEARGAGRTWARGARRRAASAEGAVWQKSFTLRGERPARGVVAYLETAAQAQALADALGASAIAGAGAGAGLGRGATASRVGPGAVRPVAVRTRVLVAEAAGYTNGVWRAESTEMAHIERFTAVSREAERGVEPPLVADPRADRRGRAAWWRGRTAWCRGRDAWWRGRDALRRGQGTPGGPARPTRPARPSGGSPVDAEAMFVGATRYRGLHSWLILSREWYPMIAKMRRLPGFRWYTVYWEAPFTLGTLAFFATRDDLLAFARLPEHRRLMQWITRGTRHGTGGYIRLHVRPDASTPGLVAEPAPTGPAPAEPPPTGPGTS